MRARTDPSLSISVSFGAISPRLSRLMACQRAEEPQTPIHLHEVGLAEQLRGLQDGRYHGGLAVTSAPGCDLRARPLWRDELAVAMPTQSPLQAFDAVPLEEAARYPLIHWQSPACEPVSALVDAAFKTHGPRPTSACVQSYELMAVLVAAGYGIGVGVRSRIAWLRAPNIAVRPLAGDSHAVTTYLLQPSSETVAAVDRLARRGQAMRT
ncbi:LysR family substrate-binding domain-containing protein [Achromobacter pestifer]|uniref:LysR substrate-binding domain-containing protein n=1 Tax=Achromobacter pestifer TaxID=1353889 RepID=A0A6S6YWA9_9BURK|nr:LysR family substrate-binding domain-containing protein [Achromobacter pestifer]CAB3646921.1 hypothetical protein LMG3431_02526 [Achromobacter pestifer]